jgi:C4-dicarboxylate-specific signal transduction histidine kinase
MITPFVANRKQSELKKLYFSDESKRILLKKGETLLTEAARNNRLYLVLEGKLDCYLKDDNGKLYEVQQSTKNMFLGVYSFFSYEQTSYLTVIAAEDTRLAFIEKNAEQENNERFARDFLPVIVHEIYLRQVLSLKMSKERQAAVKKLYESEKIILLGQLAAGLAHELNNAVGILERNTEWLITELSEFLKRKNLIDLFLSALEGGQKRSTVQIRERREHLETHFGLTTKLAKQLAKTALTMPEIEKLIGTGLKDFDTIHQITEAAIVLHDMRIAAGHATHVVMSVRDLGSNRNAMPVETSLYDTINKALTLTKNLTKQVNVKIDKQTEGTLWASPGDLVQIWVNLIKNACESMVLSGTPQPSLSILIHEEDAAYTVTIADNGGGISPDILKRIFEPSFTTKVNGLSFGLGLGLSIVKKIVDSYKGSVRVTSKTGETAFIVQLPKS